MSKALEDRYSTYVLTKARRIPEEDITQHETDPTVWFVKSSRTGSEHRVQFVEDWVICTCQHGDIKVSSAKCYHSARAEMAREELRNSGDPDE